MISQELNDIPTQSVDVDPSTACPFRPRFVEEVLQRLVVQFSLFDLIFTEVHRCYLGLLQVSSYLVPVYQTLFTGKVSPCETTPSAEVSIPGSLPGCHWKAEFES